MSPSHSSLGHIMAILYTSRYEDSVRNPLQIFYPGFYQWYFLVGLHLYISRIPVVIQTARSSISYKTRDIYPLRTGFSLHWFTIQNTHHLLLLPLTIPTLDRQTHHHIVRCCYYFQMACPSKLSPHPKPPISNPMTLSHGCF